MNWNEEQKHAVEWTGNLIVSAAAGAGKTTVLTGRVIHLIKDLNVGIDEMLILTFTRAAAAEMRNRIEKELAKAEHAETDPDKKRMLQRQLLLCPNASIATIDAFCSSVVHRHYYRLDLAPGMGTVTNTEEAILFDEASQAAAEEMIAETPEQYKTLLRAFGSADKVAGTVKKLHVFVCAQPDRDGWLESIETDCRDGSLTRSAEEKIFKSCRAELEAVIGTYQLWRNKTDAFGDKYEKHVRFADEQLSVLRAALLMETPAKYSEVLKEVPLKTEIKNTKNMQADGVGYQMKQCRDTLTSIVPEHIKLFEDAGEEETGNGQVTVIVEALLALLRRTQALYSAQKLEKGKIDFADMEYYAVKLLSIPEVAEEYRERFKTVIVDEYQDSNRLQEAILDRIRRPGGLFLVGDIKQSIYGFRMAVPDLFKEKTDTYGQGIDGRRIDLNSNFRSSQEVLDAVNGVFSRLMTLETGILEYDETQALRRGMDQPEGKAELVLLDCEDEGAEDRDEELENPEAEAMFCVETIRSIMENEMYTERGSEKTPRPYRYSDFTVLLRSGSAMEDMARVFTEEGIPCYAESSGGFFDSIEVQLFLNVLRIIDNRRQDIPLLSVMRSSVGEYTDEELIALRCLCPNKGEDILTCLMTAAEKEPGGKADLFLQKLESWRKKSLYMPVREFCSLLLDETGILLEMSVLPGSKQREANLNEVLSLAGEYDNAGSFGLHGFLRFADKAREKDKIGSPSAVTGNVVRFTTVHKSKGLEYPVVFYCDLGRKFNDSDRKDDLLLNNELGIGIRYTDAWNVKHEPRLYSLLSRRIAAAGKEEEMRVMYVGMTRAERKLYMVGSKKNLKKYLAEKMPSFVSAAELRDASTPLIWLLLLTEEEGPAKQALPRHIIEKGCFTRTPHTEETDGDAPDPEKLRALSLKLAREYPYPAPAGVPNKTSATALSGAEKVYEFAEDPFGRREEDAQTRALKHGTDIHALLEKMPLGTDKEAARRAMLAPLPYNDRASLDWFLGTELFARMQASPLCRRELPFTAAVKSETIPGLEAGEDVLLQGVIDCCFIENDGYVVLDYKTDSFRGKTAEEQAETHREQVELYSRVLSELTGKPVREQYIVFITERAVVRLS